MTDYVIGCCFCLVALCLIALIVAGVSGMLGSTPDPCIQHHAKTSDRIFTGWHDYGGRQVWCGPGRRR